MYCMVTYCTLIEEDDWFNGWDDVPALDAPTVAETLNERFGPTRPVRRRRGDGTMEIYYPLADHDDDRCRENGRYLYLRLRVEDEATTTRRDRRYRIHLRPALDQLQQTALVQSLASSADGATYAHDPRACCAWITTHSRVGAAYLDAVLASTDSVISYEEE